MDRALAKKTVTSAVWTYLSFIMSSVSVFITTVVLTRLISQEDFGIVGFVLTAMAFLDAIRDLGVGDAMVQWQGDVEEISDTAFITNMATNGVVWIGALLITPLVAAFFREPMINQLMPVMSLSFIINALGTTHMVRLKREMAFNVLAFPEVMASIAKGAVSVVLALMGFDVWALVLGLVIGRLTFVICVWWVEPWRPSLNFDMGIARKLLNYGYKISIDSLITAVQENVDYVFIGRLLGDVALGLYTVAFRIPEMVIMTFSSVLGQVLFPAYSSISSDEGRLRGATLSILRYTSILLLPAGIGLAVVGPLAARAIFSEEWHNVGPVMGVLAIYSTLLAISWNLGDVYKATDRVDILWKTALVESIILAPVLYFAAQVDVLTVAIGHAVVALLISTMRLVIAARILRLKPERVLMQFVPAVVGTVIMIPAAIFTMSLTESWAPLPSLLVTAGVGAAVYAGAMWWFERELILEVYYILRHRIEQFRSRNKPDEETDDLFPEYDGLFYDLPDAIRFLEGRD